MSTININITIEQLHKELLAVQSELTVLKQSRDVDRAAIANLETKVSVIETKIAQIERSITGIEINTACIAKDTNELKTTIAKIVGGITALGIVLANIKPLLAILGLL